MKKRYKIESIAQQSGNDREGQPWVGFDFSGLDVHEFLNEPSFQRCMAFLDYMAHRIAAEMFLTAVARHEFMQLKSYELFTRGLSDRQIGDALHVDHKTAKRWYEEVANTLTEVSPLGRQIAEQNTKTMQKDAPISPSIKGSNVQSVTNGGLT